MCACILFCHTYLCTCFVLLWSLISDDQSKDETRVNKWSDRDCNFPQLSAIYSQFGHHNKNLMTHVIKESIS